MDKRWTRKNKKSESPSGNSPKMDTRWTNYAVITFMGSRLILLMVFALLV